MSDDRYANELRDRYIGEEIASLREELKSNKNKPEELKRLYDFNVCTNAPYILLTEYLNKELDQIYTAINELRKDIKF